MILQCLIALLATWINRHQEQTITYLREENRLLKTQRKGRRIHLTNTERRRLAVLAHPIDRKRLKQVSSIATPDTHLRWYRRLVIQAPGHTTQRKQPGQPCVGQEIEPLVVRMANEPSRWGYRRMQGAWSNVGYHIDKITVRNILRRNPMDPAPIRGQAGMSWAQGIKAHLDVLRETDFFATQVAKLQPRWTMVTKLVRNLGARCMQVVVDVRYGARSILTLLAQPGPDLWSRFLLGFDARCRLVFGRHQRVSDGLYPFARLVLSPPTPSQSQVYPIEQERVPLDADGFDLTAASRRARCQRGGARLCLVPLTSHKSQSDKASDKSRRQAPFADSYATAA